MGVQIIADDLSSLWVSGTSCLWVWFGWPSLGCGEQPEPGFASEQQLGNSRTIILRLLGVRWTRRQDYGSRMPKAALAGPFASDRLASKPINRAPQGAWARPPRQLTCPCLWPAARLALRTWIRHWPAGRSSLRRNKEQIEFVSRENELAS